MPFDDQQTMEEYTTSYDAEDLIGDNQGRNHRQLRTIPHGRVQHVNLGCSECHDHAQEQVRPEVSECRIAMKTCFKL